NTLMMNLVRQYGRTCRRYNFDVLNNETVAVSTGEFAHCAEYYSASADVMHGLINGRQSVNAPSFAASMEFYTASL
ncbi:hypothetical protein KU75_25810, partial [Pectobacterium odoriferum]